MASNPGVDPLTVSCTVQRFQRTGSVKKAKDDSSTLSQKLTDVVQFLILQLVLECPGIYLHEIPDKVEHTAELDLNCINYLPFLTSTRIKSTKIQLVAKQRDEILREMFMSDISIHNTDTYVHFLDERGCDRRYILRCYAYSWRGKPAKAHKLLVRGEHLSAVAFMNTKCVFDCNAVHGSVNDEQFYKTIQKTLLPHLIPYNSTNPHSIVIMGNASIYYFHSIQEMINEVGALLL